MLADCHWHTMGRETAADIGKALDIAGLDRAVLIAPYFGEGIYYPGMPIEEANKWLAKIASELPDRVFGFAWIEPKFPGAVQEVERCINDYRLHGFKMIPNHWSPIDEAIFPVYEKIQEVRAPTLFHSGIDHGFGDSSRFCQPILFEVLINFPRLRFALAHIGWPWVDECIALLGRFRHEAEQYTGPGVKQCQMFIDITPGTPPVYREDALRKALAYCGDDSLIWGSDSHPTGAERARRVLESDRQIFTQQLGAAASSQQKIFGDNLMAFLKMDS